MAMSVITRWYYLCLTPKTCKKHRGIEAWLRQCGSDEDTKLVTEVRRLQLRMAHTFLNVLLGPLTHEPPKWCRQDDDYFGTISWKVMLLFHFFLFAISGCGVRFLDWTWRMWFFWRTYHPPRTCFLMCLEAIWPNDGWVILVKTMEFFTIFLGSNGNASNEKGPGNFRCVHRPWSWSVASYTAEMGKNTS